MDRFAFWAKLSLWSYCLSVVKGELIEVCSAEKFQAICPVDSVIVMVSAVYGRMRLGSCIQTEADLGCTNDVLHLADMWCSGLQRCAVLVPNKQLKAANTHCTKDLTTYLEVDYHCVKVSIPATDRCSFGSPVTIQGHEGHLSSHVTTETGCGSPLAPWIIEVYAGQTINTWLMDFSAHESSLEAFPGACLDVLGYVIERNVGSNFTICSTGQRNRELYSSKTNRLEVVVLSLGMAVRDRRFLIKYQVIGCPDLTPPAHAWYKREGSEAVIGCKSNDRVWRLYCNGNTWNGVVGNCSEYKDKNGYSKLEIDLPYSSVIFLTCVVCAALLLIVIVVVAGSVYVKKQSIKHRITLRSEYACMTMSSSQYATGKYGGRDVTMDRVATLLSRGETTQPFVQISDKAIVATQEGVDMNTLTPQHPSDKMKYRDETGYQSQRDYQQ